MQTNQFAKATILLSAVMFSLTGCQLWRTTHPKVQGASPTPYYVAPSAAGGAFGGMAVAATTGGSVPVGAAAGAAVGSVIGLVSESPSHMLTKIAEQPGFQVVSIDGVNRILIYSDTCFETNSAVVAEVCKPHLEFVAALMKKCPKTQFTIAGYTDEVLDAASAHSLTKRQAESIEAFLWTRGVPYQQMDAQGFGGEDPIASNFTTDGSYQNRRIEIRWRED